MTEMIPSQAHRHCEVLFNAGVLLINTWADPGAQGIGVTGMQGIGVNTPSFATVAAITTGFVGALHRPKD